MKTRLLFVMLSFMAVAARAQVFFSQNFDGKTLAQIQSATPDASQFDLADVTNPDGAPTISVQDNKLRMDRTGGVTGDRVFFVRSTPLSPATQFIKVSFKFKVSNITVNATSSSQFSFGREFTKDGANENDNSWERIGISNVAGGKFNLRDVTGTPVDGTQYDQDTEYTITFYLNATTETQTYTTPDNQQRTIPGARWNAWVDNDLQFASPNRTVANSSIVIDNFKYFISSSTATYEIDDFVMEALPVGTTPVSLVSFTGKNNGTGNELQWVTSSEQNNSYFEILRSADGISFTQIGTKAGNGTTQQLNNYSFTDNEPLAGVNYYKLRQVDFDGKTEEFDVIAVNNTLQNNNLKAYITDDNQLALQVSVVKSGNANVEIRNVAGKKIADGITHLNQGVNQFYMSVGNLEKGVYVVSVQNGDFVQRTKFVR